MYTSLLYNNDEEGLQKLKSILDKWKVKYNFEKPKWDYYAGTRYLDNGYIDHASDGDAKEFVERMLNHEHALIKYLFSDESFVVTGNDNSDEEEREWMDEQTDVDYPHKTYYKGN